MKISELISALDHIRQVHGDLDVERMDMTGERVPIGRPDIAHRAKLKGRESKPRFAESYFYEDNYESTRKGEPVCKL